MVEVGADPGNQPRAGARVPSAALRAAGHRAKG